MQLELQVAAGRASLATYERGDGQPVIFLHANVCDSRMWQEQMAALGAGARAIAYDRRGFGRTVAAPEDFSPVADLMAVAGGRPAILVGCSQGGRIALDAALRHPSQVAGLVLIAPSVSGAPEPAHPPAIAQALARQKAAEAAGDLDRLNAIKAQLWLDGPLAPEGRVAGPARSLFLAMNGIALRAPSPGASLDADPAFGRLQEVRVPTLVIWGTLDFPHIQARSRHLAATIPGAQGCELAGVAHLPSLEQPALVNAALVPFIQSHC